MKKLFILSLLLFSFNGWAENSNYVRGEMICTIKDQVVLTMRDGKSERYGAIEGGLRIGDKATFAYEITNSDIAVIVFHDSENKDSKKDNIFIGLYERHTVLTLENDDVAILGHSRSNQLYVSENKLDAQYENSHLSLERYFKDDWNGIATFRANNLSRTMTLDCRQKSNRYDDFLQKLRELATNKP